VRPVVFPPCWLWRLCEDFHVPCDSVRWACVVFRISTIYFCFPMLHLHVLYCYVILPNVLYMLSVWLESLCDDCIGCTFHLKRFCPIKSDDSIA
jgi:hypothetical protein